MLKGYSPFNFTYPFVHLKLKSMAQKDLVWYWVWVLWYGFSGYPDLESLYLVWCHPRYWVTYIRSNYTGRSWVLLFCKLLCSSSNLEKECTWTTVTTASCLGQSNWVYSSTWGSFCIIVNNLKCWSFCYRVDEVCGIGTLLWCPPTDFHVGGHHIATPELWKKIANLINSQIHT